MEDLLDKYIEWKLEMSSVIGKLKLPLLKDSSATFGSLTEVFLNLSAI